MLFCCANFREFDILRFYMTRKSTIWQTYPTNRYKKQIQAGTEINAYFRRSARFILESSILGASNVLKLK